MNQEACAGTNADYVISLPYYSKVKYRAPRVGAGAGPFTYTIPVGTKVSAFSYAKQQLKTSGGFTTLDGNATDSDTNLEKGAETIAGEKVHVTGISIMPQAAGTDVPAAGAAPDLRLQDSTLMAALGSLVSVTLNLNSRLRFLLGVKTMLPGGGALYGVAPNMANFLALAGDPNSQGFPGNGIPARGNQYGFPEGIVWNPAGSGDSLLTVDFEVNRTIVVFSGGDIDNPLSNVAASNLPAVVATGTRGYTFPTIIMSEWLVQLHGFVEGPRSRAI